MIFHRGPKPAQITDLVAYVMARCHAEDGCLLWNGAMRRNGVTHFRLACCGHRNARVVLWEADGRALKRGHVFARPKCDARCIWPAHQSYVTRKNQMERAVAAGRVASGPALSAIRIVQARRLSTVNSIDKVRAMRARYAEIENAAQVGREFGVSPNYAHQIVTGKAWREPSPWAGLA